MEQFGEYDVVIAGGGLAGVCAATAAARAGAHTILIEKQAYAGGIATASLEPSICNYFRNSEGEFVLEGCPRELIDRMVENCAVSKNWWRHRGHVIFDVELGKLAMDQMLEDAGVEILYDTLVAGVLMEGRGVTGLQIANRSGLQSVRAGCVVDATGDNDVADYAGAKLRTGGSSHSIVFRLGNVDIDAIVDYIRQNPSEHFTDRDVGLTHKEAMEFYEDTGTYLFHHFAAKKMRMVQEPIERGEYSAEWGRFCNMDAFQMHGIRWNNTLVINTGFFNLEEPDGQEISDVLREGRKMAHHVAAFARENFPGCEDSFILATPDAPGIRRTRWLDGEYTLDRETYDSGPTFDDAVGRGVVMTASPMHPTDRAFEIPLRCLLPREVDGLLIGSGRGASSNPAELLRVMPITMATGQGAGVAAAVAALKGIVVRDVDIGNVQSELRKQGVEVS
jgi:hypothetical protein